MSRALISIIVLLAVSTAMPSAAQSHACEAAAHYKVIAVPLHPARINDPGVVAGTKEENSLATWSQKDGLHEIETPAGFTNPEVDGLNTNGDIVGHDTSRSSSGAETTQGFAVLDKHFMAPFGADSKAKAIDDSGHIAVEKSAGGPFLWSDNKLTPLGACCGGHVFAISRRGEIIGEINDREGHFHAFVWDAKHGITQIGPPESRSSTALAINGSGHILLQAFTPNGIFLRDEGKLNSVELSSDYASQPLALNDCDVIVGEYGAASDYYHAFIWDKQNGFRDLNKLIDKSDGWNLEQAIDINNRGEIVGTGDHANQGDEGFLLVPQR